MTRLITLNMTVEDPVVIDEENKILKTRLTHPKLEGELYFVHTQKGEANDYLKAVDDSPISAVLGLCSTLKEIIDGNSNVPSRTGTGSVKSSSGPA